MPTLKISGGTERFQHADNMLNIAVVGGGIIGISTVRELVRYLEEQNHNNVNVDLYTDKLGTNPVTASYGAGGLFRIPSEACEQIGRSARLRRMWTDSFDHFNSVCSKSRDEAVKEYGVFRAPAYYLTRNPDENIHDRLWGDLAAQLYPDYEIIDGLVALHAQDHRHVLPLFAKGVFHKPLIIDSVIYMQRLLSELSAYTKAADIPAEIEHGQQKPSILLTVYEGLHVSSLNSLAPQRQNMQRTEHCAGSSSTYDIVINCTGLGSYTLVEDHSMFPVRGHMTRVDAPSNMPSNEVLEDHVLMMFAVEDVNQQPEYADNSSTAVAADDPSSKAEYYLIPQTRCRIACGGIRQANCWSVEVDMQERTHIMDLCRKNYKNPSFDWDKAEIVEDWVGLRPFRNEGERVEIEWCETAEGSSTFNETSFHRDGSQAIRRRKCIIHNYGHGASGICLSYGSAKRVVELAAEVLNSPK